MTPVAREVGALAGEAHLEADLVVLGEALDVERRVVVRVRNLLERSARERTADTRRRDEAEELQRLAELSDPKVTIETGGLSPEATELANRLARDIGRLSQEDLSALQAELIKRVR